VEGGGSRTQEAYTFAGKIFKGLDEKGFTLTVKSFFISLKNEDSSASTGSDKGDYRYKSPLD
jgi:hypothetical protein